MRNRRTAARLAARWNGARRRKGGKHPDVAPDANLAGQMYPEQSLQPATGVRRRRSQTERAATHRDSQRPHARHPERSGAIVPAVGSGYALVTGGVVGRVDPKAPQRQVGWAAVLRILVRVITVMGWIEVVAQGVASVWWWLSNWLLHLAR